MFSVPLMRIFFVEVEKVLKLSWLLHILIDKIGIQAFDGFSPFFCQQFLLLFESFYVNIKVLFLIGHVLVGIEMILASHTFLIEVSLSIWLIGSRFQIKTLFLVDSEISVGFFKFFYFILVVFGFEVEFSGLVNIINLLKV